MQDNEGGHGLYIHIPFCHRACTYCDFHFSTSTKQVEEYVAALIQEISLQVNYLPDRVLRSVYFGGGTPSLLPVEHILKILDTVFQHYQLTAQAEVTLEANPEDITAENVLHWKNAGINRLSIGVQSFFDHHLLWMNRTHSGRQAIDALETAFSAGMSNITADLMYGLPNLTDAEFESNIRQMIALELPHISAYALTVEPKTALAHHIKTGKTLPPEDARAVAQFEMLRTILEDAGYIHYEISSFAKAGKIAIHNSGYWQGRYYLGLGASAHSYNGNSRQWNLANNAKYISSIQAQIIPAEIEVLDPIAQQNEFIMTALRTMWGLDLNTFKRKFGEAAAQRLGIATEDLMHQGKIELRNATLHISRPHIFIADSIIAQLFAE